MMLRDCSRLELLGLREGQGSEIGGHVVLLAVGPPQALQVGKETPQGQW